MDFHGLSELSDGRPVLGRRDFTVAEPISRHLLKITDTHIEIGLSVIFGKTTNENNEQQMKTISN